MEPLHSQPETDPNNPKVVALVEQTENKEPIYHFFIDGIRIDDVGATRQKQGDSLVSYDFFNDYQPFAAADIILKEGVPILEWYGPEGDHRPQDYLDLLPYLVDAAVYADYGTVPFAESEILD